MKGLSCFGASNSKTSNSCQLLVVHLLSQGFSVVFSWLPIFKHSSPRPWRLLTPSSAPLQLFTFHYGHMKTSPNPYHLIQKKNTRNSPLNHNTIDPFKIIFSTGTSNGTATASSATCRSCQSQCSNILPWPVGGVFSPTNLIGFHLQKPHFNK